ASGSGGGSRVARLAAPGGPAATTTSARLTLVGRLVLAGGRDDGLGVPVAGLGRLATARARALAVTVAAAALPVAVAVALLAVAVALTRGLRRGRLQAALDVAA